MCGETGCCFTRWPNGETNCGGIATITESGYHHTREQNSSTLSERTRVDFPYQNSLFQKRASMSLLHMRNSTRSVSLIKMPLQSDVDSLEIVEQNGCLHSRYDQTYGEEDSFQFSGYPDMDPFSEPRSSLYSTSSGERSPNRENNWMTYREISPANTMSLSPRSSVRSLYQALSRSISHNPTFEKQIYPSSVEL